ncbi:Reticulocalbin 3, EF-hand calcium binding domain [Branchiostoma belcheri]|nr:Reticulocalbin 3, EF-hand calcium binding domain [Branchiostoma belcheri]
MRLLVVLLASALVLTLTPSSDGKEIPKEEEHVEENYLSVNRQIRPFGAPAGSARCPIITGRDVDDTLTQSEAIRRLGVVYGIMDRDGDGFTSEGELAAWFGAVIGRQLDDEVDRVWGLYDVNGAGRLSWDMRLQTYNAVQGRSESELDPTCQTYLKMMARDERRWKRADQDSDGFLSRDEFAAYLYPADFDFMYETVVEDFIDEYDVDGNGVLSLSEFTSIFGSSCGVDTATLQGQFRSRDTDGDGQLGIQELISWVIRFGYDSNADQATRLIQDADTDTDGRLSLSEIQAYYRTVLSDAGGGRGDAGGNAHRCSFAFLLYWHIHNTFTDGYWQNWSWATYRPRTYTGFGSIATVTGTGGGTGITTGTTVTGVTGTGGRITTGGGGSVTTTTTVTGGTTGGTTTGGRGGVVIYDYTETGTGGDRRTPDGGVVTYSTDDRGGGVSYTIDAQGRRIYTTADGQRYYYDELGNLIYITTATITTTQRYYIDADGNRVYIGEDGRHYRTGADGSRIYITTGTGSTTTTERFIVDAQGNRIYTGADGRRYRYDDQGNIIYITTTGGGTVTTSERYIIDSQGQRIYTGADGRRYRYGPDGNIIYITTTGGGGGTIVTSTTDTYVVDAEGNRVYTGADGRRYRYGADGTILYIVVGERYTTADGRAYTYDGSGRIVYYTEDGRTYRYDDEGNLLYVTLSAGGTVTTTGTEERFTVDSQGNRVEFFTTADGRRYTYDSAGNILYYTDDGRAYRYDSDGQIVYVTSGEGRTVTFVGSGFENGVGGESVTRRFRVDASGNVIGLGDQPAEGRAL